MDNENGMSKKRSIFRTYQVIWYILGVIEALLGLRILLLFLGANPSNPFAAFIYALSYPFAYPFLGLFPTPALGGSVFEWSSIIAMAVYWLLAWGIVKVLQIAKPVDEREVVEKVDDPELRI
jgi:hypothetical protein